jgi:hypothetical protein
MSHWQQGHSKECKRLVEGSWKGLERAAIECYQDDGPQGFSRDYVPLLEKAIGLTWTLREHPECAFWHLALVKKRGTVEHCHPVDQEGVDRVSELILRALRRLKWPPRAAVTDRFYEMAFLTVNRLHIWACTRRPRTRLSAFASRTWNRG